MLQRKKLEYYAKQYGIEDLKKVKLTDDDCVRICNAVGVPLHRAASFGGDICVLISLVMDDPGYINAHRKEGVSEDLILIRCGDYAAVDVFKAYTSQ